MVEVHRLLHVNYNCHDVDAMERWYTAVFDLRPVMRSDALGANGAPFGVMMPTAAKSVFLYDHRGGRRATALEMVQWRDPATIGRPYANAWDHGIQAVAFAAPDLEAVAASAVSLGGAVVRRDDAVLLLRDPAGVNVEVYPGAAAEQLHLRIVVHDLAASLAWWGRLGFAAGGAPPLPGAQVWAGDAEHSVADETAIVATDDPTFSLVLNQWSGPPPVGPSYGAPYHAGLYRMAMAVDDVGLAWEALRAEGLAIQPPFTFDMPGTKITDGLTVLFLRDPDGILVELVERPRSYFRDPASSEPK